MGSLSVQGEDESHIDASHSRQPLVKGERLNLQEGHPSETKGGFTFSEAPFEAILHAGEGGFTFGRLQGGLKRLQGVFKAA